MSVNHTFDMWDTFDKELIFGYTKNLQHKEKKGK